MAYVLRIRRYDELPAHVELVEMTADELRKAQTSDNKQEHRRVSADEAHRHVRRGGLHMTGLWIDDLGRMRKATPNT